MYRNSQNQMLIHHEFFLPFEVHLNEDNRCRQLAVMPLVREQFCDQQRSMDVKITLTVGEANTLSAVERVSILGQLFGWMGRIS